jgi:hypothetical protein
MSAEHCKTELFLAGFLSIDFSDFRSKLLREFLEISLEMQLNWESPQFLFFWLFCFVKVIRKVNEKEQRIPSRVQKGKKHEEEKKRNPR